MTAVVIEVLFIILLILGNGVLAMSELAIVSARKARLKHLAERGSDGAGVALKLAEDPNQFLSTVQIGITLVGILAGAFGGATLAEQLGGRLQQIPMIAPYSEAVGVVLVVLAITYLSLIFGELVPKRLALSGAERIASAIAKPMQFLSIIASPAVRLLSLSTEAVLKLVGQRPSVEPPVTEEEIRIMIRQGITAGVFEEAEVNLVENVFRLGDRRVSAIMTTRHGLTWLDIDDPPEVHQRIIAESVHSRFPVCKGSIDNVIGVVRAKDLLAQHVTGQPLNISATLRQPLLIPETTRALKALEIFKQTGRHVALVVDEFGGTEGLVTHHDVLEAIVGDIPVTGEQVELRVVQREDGSWLVDGSLLIDEFKALFRLRSLPGEEDDTFQTIGGFVMMYMGRIPSSGEYFEWNGLRIEVIDMDGRRIDKLLIAPIQSEDTAD